MADTYLVDPDIGFIKELAGRGGQDLKKCFQCATCSVACKLAPDNKPFPRKEMIAASWGLKDRLIANHDIWLCHNCGDCSTLCPRGAKPGDVLSALRSYTISEYAAPKAVVNALSDPKKLPFLVAIPVVLFIVVGLITGLLDFTPAGDRIVHAKFFSTWLVDMMMLPAAIWTAAIFALAIRRFLTDIHENALQNGKTDKTELDAGGFIFSLIKVIPTILTHSKFSECTENRDREIPHLLVLFGFVGLFIVTSIFFLAIYGLQIHGPYSQLNPVKWLANISAVALIVGSGLMIKNRRAKSEEQSGYWDWYLICLAFGLGVSGMLAQLTRLADWAAISYTVYFLHLVLVFCLFAYLPFSKLAHLVYRTIAMAYDTYIERQ